MWGTVAIMVVVAVVAVMAVSLLAGILVMVGQLLWALAPLIVAGAVGWVLWGYITSGRS